MGIALHDGLPARQRSRRSLWLCFWLMIFSVGLTSYCIVVLTYSNLGSPSSAVSDEHKPGQHDHNDETHSEPKPVEDTPEIDDRFMLHPENHIHRQPKTISLQWNVTKEAHRPDGVLRDIYFINGQFPGPTIEARSGDELEITVTNSITNDTADGIAIHWHGMLMKGFNDMDGAVGVTQCTIDEGNSFTYKFRIADSQHGTFWYHAHSAVKRADGLYGGLVVHRPVSDEQDSDVALYEYDAEKLMLIGDWYHFPAEQVLDQYKDFLSFANEPVADSLLINGVGSYNCSMARPGKPVDCVETDTPDVQVAGNKAVRLRIINTGASAGYSFELANAALQLITVDGGGTVSNSTPQAPTLGVVYPGERIDVLLLPAASAEEKRHEGDLTMKIVLDPELMPIMNPALARIQTFPLTWPRTPSPRINVREQVDIFDLATAQGSDDYSVDNPTTLPEPAETALLYTTVSPNSYKEDAPWGELNHTSFVWKDAHAKPLLAMDKKTWENGTEQANPMREFGVPKFAAGEGRWMELVVNNIDDKGHPFHLHGHEFYVISSERQAKFGKPYNPFETAQFAAASKLFNTETPLRKDTVYIRPQGYVVVRVKLDNPGLWLMHCHVLWHQAVGMGIVMQVGNVTDEVARRAAESCRM